MSPLYVVKLTATEIDHLSVLLTRNHDDGIYWGNKAQYWRRHERIQKKLIDLPRLKPAEDQP